MKDPAALYKTPEGYAAVMQWYESALAGLEVAHSSHDVETRFGRTHMLVMGPPDGPPLVMVQGYGASAPLWYKQFPALAQRCRIYALDTVGQPGRSAPTPLSLAGEDYALWLLDVLDALELPQADMMGVCLGGWAVLRLGIMAPERLRRAVLLSPVGLARFKVYLRSGVPLILNMRGDPEKYAQRLMVEAFTPPGSNLSFDRQLARALMLSIRHYRIGVAAGLLGQQARPVELARALRVLLRFVRSEPAAELRRFTAPALLLVGQHEAIYNPQRAVQRALAAMPRLQAEIVPAAGHAAIYDRPEYVNPRIMDFLVG